MPSDADGTGTFSRRAAGHGRVRRAWFAASAFGVALALAAAARATESAALERAAGALVLVAAGFAVAALPWRRWLPEMPPMPGLFPRLAAGQRWCASCGTVAGRGPCPSCGEPARRR